MYYNRIRKAQSQTAVSFFQSTVLLQTLNRCCCIQRPENTARMSQHAGQMVSLFLVCYVLTIQTNEQFVR